MLVEDDGRAAEIGAEDCLAEPFELDDLLRVVEKHVGLGDAGCL